MRESVRSVIGGKVADALPTLWNLDKQYEIHTAWRNTGIPGCKRPFPKALPSHWAVPFETSKERLVTNDVAFSSPSHDG